MTDILEKETSLGMQAASLGFNATLPDAPHGSNLLTYSVVYQERGDPGFTEEHLSICG
jgi:hypothetical protein